MTIRSAISEKVQCKYPGVPDIQHSTRPPTKAASTKAAPPKSTRSRPSTKAAPPKPTLSRPSTKAASTKAAAGPTVKPQLPRHASDATWIQQIDAMMALQYRPMIAAMLGPSLLQFDWLSHHLGYQNSDSIGHQSALVLRKQSNLEQFPDQ